MCVCVCVNEIPTFIFYVRTLSDVSMYQQPTYVRTLMAFVINDGINDSINSLTAIGARERQHFYELRSILVFRQIFVRC